MHTETKTHREFFSMLSQRRQEMGNDFLNIQRTEEGM